MLQDAAQCCDASRQVAQLRSTGWSDRIIRLLTARSDRAAANRRSLRHVGGEQHGQASQCSRIAHGGGQATTYPRAGDEIGSSAMVVRHCASAPRSERRCSARAASTSAITRRRCAGVRSSSRTVGGSPHRLRAPRRARSCRQTGSSTTDNGQTPMSCLSVVAEALTSVVLRNRVALLGWCREASPLEVRGRDELCLMLPGPANQPRPRREPKLCASSLRLPIG